MELFLSPEMKYGQDRGGARETGLNKKKKRKKKKEL